MVLEYLNTLVVRYNQENNNTSKGIQHDPINLMYVILKLQTNKAAKK